MFYFLFPLKKNVVVVLRMHVLEVPLKPLWCADTNSHILFFLLFISQGKLGRKRGQKKKKNKSVLFFVSGERKRLADADKI